MNLKKEDTVVTLKMVSGEEIVGMIDSKNLDNYSKLDSNNVTRLTVVAPFSLGISPHNGQPTLIPYIFTSGIPVEQTLSVPSSGVTFVGMTDVEIAKEYQEMIAPGSVPSQIVTPGSKIIM